MCGIAGLIDFRASMRSEEIEKQVVNMRDALTYRGPDASGLWQDAAGGVGLGHRRLSIVDLSPMGHQPMVSASGRYVVVFNGEIYNFPKLRGLLEAAGVTFRSHSDTEVLLEAIEKWGFERAIREFNGMFAFALWDRADRALYLARDRFGEKPLYYAQLGHVLVFGSELKALRAFERFDRSIDRASLAQLVRFTCVPSPATIYEGVRKLPPATWLRIERAEDIAGTPSCYWSATDVARAARANPFRGDERAAVESLDVALRESIRMRMIADVPLGAFLSGGIDSSTIVALMQAQSDRPVRTFTIGFNEKTYDEAVAAKAVARHLGTDHVELYVTPNEAMAVIPKLPYLYDEPFADSSQIPTHLVAQLARRHVTVALSGDAGDELFAGYNRYAWTENVWRVLSRIPRRMRPALAAALRVASPDAWQRGFDRVAPAIPRSIQVRMFGDKVHKLADVLGAADQAALYVKLLSVWPRPTDVVHGTFDRPVDIAGEGLEFTERMMLTDTTMYLPNDILVKVDRAAMGVSLETRVPMLDPNVFAFAWSVPLEMKLKAGRAKHLLRAVLEKYLPHALFERPKMGFGVPIDAWLRGELREWAEDLLAERRLSEDGFFNPMPIRKKWAEHISTRRNWHHQLWPILMFQAWRAETT